METLIACDFFTKPVYTLLGRVEVYALFFIHLGSRKVYCSPATLHPDNAWVVQQARNASMWLAGEGERAEMLIHDGDTKFSREFKLCLGMRGYRMSSDGPPPPKQNAFAENFIGTIKRECLNHFVWFQHGSWDTRLLLIQSFNILGKITPWFILALIHHTPHEIIFNLAFHDIS